MVGISLMKCGKCWLILSQICVRSWGLQQICDSVGGGKGVIHGGQA